MATAIRVRAAEGGKISEITRLESAEAERLEGAEATGMPAACTDISSGSVTLDTSLN